MSRKVSSSNAGSKLLAGLITGAVVLGSVAGCTSAADSGTSASSSTATSTGSGNDTASASGLFDSSTVQNISVDFDPDTYQAMIDSYVDTGEKEWISATVTINGTVFSDVGIKLKGNSSLMGLRGQGPGGAAVDRPTSNDSTTSGSDSTTDAGATTVPSTPESAAPTTSHAAPQTSDAAAPGAGGFMGGASVSADEPEGLPWRIRLDKFVDGQNYQGETDFVVRANNSETSLNEAVALDLIDAAGMPSEDTAAVKFTVNGSEQRLRLLVETPDDQWYSDNVGAQGILYKAEAGGDYSYRGDDPAAYTEVFEVEANTSQQSENEYAPLIAFLKWLNESDDATFAAELDQWLDIDSFADYLAIQDLVVNSDDIDGPGNNSYLSYDEETGLFTVISWDQNLAFGAMGGMDGGRPDGTPPTGADGQNFTPPSGFQLPEGMELPSGVELPEGMQMPGGSNSGGGRPGGLGGNVLSEKFLANEQFAALVTQATADLRTELYGSGTAQQILDSWTATLTEQASDLVSADTIASESSAIADHFTS